jgi:drug/metabolite transporter (DMT)-like permease
MNRQNTLWLALGALLGCGALLGLSTNLAKVAYSQGIAPLAFLMWSLAGATLILGIVSLLKKQSTPKNKGAIKYYFIAAFFSVAGSNLIFFSAVPHVGVSFVALTIALPPLLTYVGALIFGMEIFSRWRATGVAFALAGTVVLVAAKWSSPGSNHLWILITLVGPVLLAAGNIYRTLGWPKGAKPESLAPGMLLAATITLILLGITIPGWSLFALGNSQNIGLIVIQSLVFAGQFSLLFILQKTGGPVLLSLIGAVGATVGIPLSMMLLDEPMLPALAPSVLLIVAGIFCMMKGQAQAIKK